MFDLLFTPDWLNRGLDSYAFLPEHLIFIFVAMAIGVALGFLLRKKSKRTIEIVIISLWAFGTFIEVLYYALCYIRSGIDPTNHPFSIEYDLPLHSCMMFFFVFPVAMFVKNKYIKRAATSFLVIVNMIMGFITLFVGCPGPGRSTLSYPGLNTLVYHAIIVIVPLIMLMTGYYKIRLYDFVYGLIAFGTLGLTIWVFDAIAGCDYFYFYDGHTFPVFKAISENVLPIVWTLIVTSCYVITGVAIHFLAILIKWLITKRVDKEEKDSIDEIEPLEDK